MPKRTPPKGENQSSPREWSGGDLELLDWLDADESPPPSGVSNETPPSEEKQQHDEAASGNRGAGIGSPAEPGNRSKDKRAPDLNRPNQYALTDKGARVVKNLTTPPSQKLATSSIKPTSDFQLRQRAGQEPSKPSEKPSEAASGTTVFTFLDDSDAHESPSSPVRSPSEDTARVPPAAVGSKAVSSLLMGKE